MLTFALTTTLLFFVLETESIKVNLMVREPYDLFLSLLWNPLGHNTSNQLDIIMGGEQHNNPLRSNF